MPFYFNHEMAIEMAGCRAVRVPTDERYQLRLDAIERAITDRTRAIVTISPNNPSGAVLSEASLRAVNELCRERGLYHLADEPYEYFTYGVGAHVSPGSFPGRGRAHHLDVLAVEGLRVRRLAHRLHGVSRGARLGDDEEPGHDSDLPDDRRAGRRASRRSTSAARYCEPHVRELASIRDIVVVASCRRWRRSRPCRRPTARSTACCACNSGVDPMMLGERLIREHKVAVIPGTAFGMTDGCYFRVAFGALQKATVAEGIGRLVKGLRAILS